MFNYSRSQTFESLFTCYRKHLGFVFVNYFVFVSAKTPTTISLFAVVDTGSCYNIKMYFLLYFQVRIILQWINLHPENFFKISQAYALVIARSWVQHDQYFPSFVFFAVNLSFIWEAKIFKNELNYISYINYINYIYVYIYIYIIYVIQGKNKQHFNKDIYI